MSEFLKSVEDYLSRCGPVRWRVVWRWSEEMPFVPLEDPLSSSRDWRGPFRTKEEAESVAKLCAMASRRAAENHWRMRDIHAACIEAKKEFAVASFQIPDVPQTVEEERQLEVDNALFERHAVKDEIFR